MQNERRTAALQRCLQWIRDPSTESAHSLLTFRIRVLLREHVGALTQAEEVAIQDAFWHATTNCKRSATQTLIHACAVGSLSLVEFLLSICGVDCAQVHLAMPILQATRRGRMEIVQLLLSKTTRPPSDEVNTRMLKEAVESGSTELVESLLERAGGHYDVNSPNMVGWSVLEIAIQLDAVEMASLLLSYGASGLYGHDNITRHVRSVAMAKLLDAHGLDFERETGWQAVATAKDRQDEPLVQFVLTHDTDITNREAITRAA